MTLRRATGYMTMITIVFAFRRSTVSDGVVVIAGKQTKD